MTDNKYNVVVDSIGTSNAANCIAFAVKHNLNPNEFIRQVFKSPSIIKSGLDKRTADELVKQLEFFGIRSRINDAVSNPELVNLYDLSVHIQDMADLDKTCLILSSILGADPDQILKMISAPGGLVLGEVSENNILDIQAQLENCAVELLWRNKETSKYDVFVSANNQALLKQIELAIGLALDPMPDGGGFIRGLEFDKAQIIWNKLRAVAGTVIINQAFLRWDVILTNASQSEFDKVAFCELTGIPKNYVEAILQNTPIIVADAVQNDICDDLIEGLTHAGCDVSAELISFKSFKIRIENGNNPAQTTRTLNALGLDVDLVASQLPQCLPMNFSYFDGRRLCATLKSNGINAEMENA